MFGHEVEVLKHDVHLAAPVLGHRLAAERGPTIAMLDCPRRFRSEGQVMSAHTAPTLGEAPRAAALEARLQILLTVERQQDTVQNAGQ